MQLYVDGRLAEPESEDSHVVAKRSLAGNRAFSKWGEWQAFLGLRHFREMITSWNESPGVPGVLCSMLAVMLN
jgi:hypothetical protein